MRYRTGEVQCFVTGILPRLTDVVGMDTRQVIARYEAERQALALMDHPNITKVLDAGATESGRPYFMMELVKDAPITEYGDSDVVGVRGRWRL